MQAQNLTDTYQSEVARWQQQKEQELRSEDGWLTLIGLEWLQAGVNTLGSAADNDIVLPAHLPARLGYVDLSAGQAHLHVQTESPVTVDGAPVRSALLSEGSDQHPPTMVKVDSITFFLIRRGDQLALRIRDANHPARASFSGRHWFPLDAAYHVPAVFVPHAESRTIDVLNSVGMTVAMQNPGYVQFALHGQTLRLQAFEARDDQWWFIFRDATSGTTTYGAGRFLYAPRGTDGKLWIDFNRAYHPPCAFTDFATCPLPPKDNILLVAVEAGERFQTGG